MPSSDIQNLINAVDAKTMDRIDKVLKSFGKESPGDSAEKTHSKKTKKAKDGDKMPGKNSATFKDNGAEDNADMDGKDSQRSPMSDRAQAALKAVARILAPFKDEITDGHMDAVQNEVGIAGETAKDEDGGEDVEMSMDAPEGVDPEHHNEAMGMAKKGYMSHMEKMGYRKYPDPALDKTNATKTAKAKDDGEEEEEEEERVGKVNKSADALDLSAFPVSQRSQLEAIFKTAVAATEANKELVKKNDDLQKQLHEERDIRVLKGFEERAKGFKHLGANSQELAVVMKSMAESDPKGFEKIESILKAADEQMRVAAMTGGGLFNELGSRQSGGGVHGPGDKLDALVDQVVQKSDGAKSREQVYEEVLKTAEGKRLYAEYKSARPHGS